MNPRKVTAGQPMRIAADAWNTLVDTATDYQARVNFKGSVLSADRSDFGIALVKNTTAADCRQYAILGIDPDTVILDPDTSEREFRQRVVLAGVTPADEHKDCFCILTEPIKAGKLGRAMLVGVTQCWVDIKNESDTCATPESDNADNLVSTSSGIARILWKQAGTGVKVAIVRLDGGGGRTSFIGRVKQDSHTENHCIVQPCLGTTDKARDVAYPEVDTSEDAEVDNVLLGGMGLDNIFVQCDPVADLGDELCLAGDAAGYPDGQGQAGYPRGQRLYGEPGRLRRSVRIGHAGRRARLQRCGHPRRGAAVDSRSIRIPSLPWPVL